MKRSRANYRYKAGEIRGLKLLLIVDEDAGGMSVTNDIGNVVADIVEKEGINPDAYFIAYKDSEGNWDGYDPVTGGFYYFRGSRALIDAGMLELKYK